MKPDPRLEQIRRRIDELDARLIKLISRRAKFAQRVAKVKQSGAGGNDSFYRPEREAQVLRRVVDRN